MFPNADLLTAFCTNFFSRVIELQKLDKLLSLTINVNS